ncbi:MAG TPA: IS630 family transposase [Urbifossiella sp.]|nr:IS630 family transposase [Urbifossiella sp.]
MSRPIGTADELERRRKRAVQAVADGQPRRTVATVLGVHVKTTSRWVRAARRTGGLDAKPHVGPTPGLTDADLERLEGLLLQGAKAHGWHNRLWTAARVARPIERHFDISYRPEHVRKVLRRRLGRTSQKPRRKARERDDKEVARWVGDEFPRIVRQAWQRSAYLVFLDESGFFLTPTVRRTLAPRGRTPVLDAWDRRDRWSATSCVTASPVAGRPGLYFDLLGHHAHGEDVAAFLKDVRRRLGRLTVTWDRNQIHSKSEVVTAWRARHPDAVAEDFPGYAPDLNPDEGVRGWTKCGRLANLAADDKDELWDHVVEELITVKYRPDLLEGFIQQTKLPGVSLAI